MEHVPVPIKFSSRIVSIPILDYPGLEAGVTRVLCLRLLKQKKQ